MCLSLSGLRGHHHRAPHLGENLHTGANLSNNHPSLAAIGLGLLESHRKLQVNLRTRRGAIASTIEANMGDVIADVDATRSRGGLHGHGILVSFLVIS